MCLWCLGYNLDILNPPPKDTMTPKELRNMAKRLLEYAKELEANHVKPPTPQPEPKSAADRVLAALKRAPSYCDRWPHFAPLLNGHAMTQTMIRRALGNAPGCAQTVETGLEQLIASGQVQQINPSTIKKLLEKGGPKPKIYGLSESVHMFTAVEDAIRAAVSASDDPISHNSDPFSHEWRMPRFDSTP